MAASGRLNVVRRVARGVLSLLTGIDGRLECLGKVNALGVRLESAAGSLDLRNNGAGVVLAAELDLSDVGGEGGVWVSETVEDADLVGGVAIPGEDAVVVGDNSETAGWGISKLKSIGAGVRLC